MDNILIKIGPETSIGARFPIVYNDNNQKIIDAINGIETHIENIRTVQTKRILPVLQYNETKYQQMKVSYDDLKDNYDELLSKYNEFSQKYDALLNAFNQIDDRIEEIIETGLVVPTNISAFDNDVGYITSTEVPAAQVNANWDATSGAGQILNKPELFSGDYNDLANKPTIPTIPTVVSAFENDVNYLTSESDPTVPEWAKAETKPTYDYSEITNTPDLSGYLTEETDPTVPNWAKAETKPTYDYSEIQNTPNIPTVPTNVSAFTNDANYITSADIPAQVNADWNAVSGAGQILNKPNISDEFVIELIGSYVNNNPVISSSITFEEMMEAYNNDKQLILKFNFTNSFFGVGSESTVYLKNFEYFELEVEDTPPPDYTYHMVIGVKFFTHVGASLLPNIFENIVLTEGNLIPNTETHSLNVSIDNIVFATSFILDTPKNATNGNVGINVMNYNSQTSDYDINNGGIIISGNNATSVTTNSNGDIIVDTPVGDGLEITQNGLQPKVDGTTIEINSNGELSVIGGGSGGSGGSGEGMVLELWGSSPNYGNVGQNLSIVILRTRDDVYQWNESSDYGGNTTDSRIRDSILSKVLDIVYGKNLPVGTARPEILVKLGYTYYRGRTDVEPIEYVTNIISGRHITYASSYLYIIYQVENFTSSSANNLRGVSRAITFSYTKEEDRIWVNPT